MTAFATSGLRFRCCVSFIGLVMLSSGFAAEPLRTSAPDQASELPVLTLEAAVHFALEHNPTLAYQRQQHGIAAGHVIIADTYPFNPVVENRIQGANGPPSAGITNTVPLEHILLWEIELRHQGRYRRQAACAALSRTDWEIAYQEQSLAVQVIKAYLNVVYRQEKLRLLELTQRVNDQLVEDVTKLANIGKLAVSDRLPAQSEAIYSRDLLHTGQLQYVQAWRDLCRALGTVEGSFRIEGVLELPPMAYDPNALREMALCRRADLHAFEMAVAEASANLRLEKANRYGNPTLGPAYTLDATGVSALGVQLNFPIPLSNRHRGEIAVSQAEHAQAIGKVDAARVDVQQDVMAAVTHLEAAEKKAAYLRTTALPQAQQADDEMAKLLQLGQTSVDLLKTIEMRRRLLQFRDNYLDALWEVTQARSEILAATGEPVLGFGTPPAQQAPSPPPQPNTKTAPSRPGSAPAPLQLIPGKPTATMPSSTSPAASPTTPTFAAPSSPPFAAQASSAFTPAPSRDPDDIWTAPRNPSK